MCPAHYSAPSRCPFPPNPGPGPQAFSREHGGYVRQAMTAFVQRHRDRGSVPAGKIAKTVFEAFPADAPAEEIARTLNGVLMGFLPTVDGNLRATLFDWLNERTLWDVQSAWLLRPPGDTPYRKALAAIAPALKRAMKMRPVPELVWRTVRQPHRLGDVEVRKDDRVVVSIVSATQQGLGDDASDVYPVFGGDRRAPQHPTHACPAYEIATGVLLGTIAALVDFLPLKPHAAPLTVYLTGPVPWPPAQAPASP